MEIDQFGLGFNMGLGYKILKNVRIKQNIFLELLKEIMV